MYISLFLYISSQRLYGICVYFGRGVNGQPASHFGLFRVGCICEIFFVFDWFSVFLCSVSFVYEHMAMAAIVVDVVGMLWLCLWWFIDKNSDDV